MTACAANEDPGLVPWWAKIGAKIVLSRLPVSYDGWRTLGVFRHGAMRDAGYAIDVFVRHFSRAESLLPTGFVALELGPGDSLASALVARAHGACATYLVDAGAFASRAEIEPYNDLCRVLEHRGRPVPGAPFTSVSEMLDRVGAMYLTGGLSSLRSLPTGRVDFVFSQAVLEHVALDEFDATTGELYRVQRDGGVSSHRVDLQDHLAHSLNSLRFSRGVWESRLFSASGFYTNRLRAHQIVEAFTRAGYEVLARDDDRWAALPLPAGKLHRDFAALPRSELLVRAVDLLARK